MEAVLVQARVTEISRAILEVTPVNFVLIKERLLDLVEKCLGHFV